MGKLKKQLSKVLRGRSLLKMSKNERNVDLYNVLAISEAKLIISDKWARRESYLHVSALCQSLKEDANYCIPLRLKKMGWAVQKQMVSVCRKPV